MDNENTPNNNFQPMTSQSQFGVATGALKNDKLKLYLLFGGAFLLLIAIIVGVVVALNGNNGGDEFEYYFVGTNLFDSTDVGFLGTDTSHPTAYEIFDDYDDYEDCYDSIDEWAEDLLEEQTKEIDNELDLKDEEDDEEDDDEEEDEGEDEDEDEDDIPTSKKQKDTVMAEYEKSLKKRVEKIKEGFDEGEFDEEFFDNYYLVLVEHNEYGETVSNWEVEGIKRNGEVLDVSFKIETTGVYNDGLSRIYFIAVPRISDEGLTSVDVNVNGTATPGSTGGHDDWFEIKKPIIYLYPTKETNVSVKLKNADLITTSYPKYTDGWDVLARPNGDLVDNKTGRNLYSLYYESKNAVDFGVKNDGFVVEGKDAADFLEEKLAVLGLNEREAEEFIVYWLPKLEANKYNYIRFATTSEINENMPLEVAPEPDTVVRVLMIFKGLDKPIVVTPQTLTTLKRTGFTVVEWGGIEI